jgi:flagellin-like hook-associated protein FlgL
LEVGPGSTIAADLGILGRVHGTLDGEDLDPLLTTATTVAQFNHGLGLELGRVQIASGDQTAIVDLSTASSVGEILSLLNSSGLPVEARVNAAATGIEIYSTDDNRSLIVTSDTLRTAEQLGIVGSPDLFGSLYLLRQALEQNNGELVRATNESIQGALDQVLFERSGAGSKQVRLEATDFRLLEQELNVTRLRSEYEDADILALSADLSKQEAVYQAALAAAARMIQPSLAQFLT